jgi:hypothetical protein
VRQAEIQDDRGGPVLIDEIQRSEAVACFLDLVAAERQRHPKHPANIIIVLNDQDGLARSRESSAVNVAVLLCSQLRSP